LDIPQRNYQGIQQFISDSPWDQGALMNQVARDANEAYLLSDNTTRQRRADSDALAYNFEPLEE
jgi:hypothetical protein